MLITPHCALQGAAPPLHEQASGPAKRPSPCDVRALEKCLAENDGDHKKVCVIFGGKPLTLGGGSNHAEV